VIKNPLHFQDGQERFFQDGQECFSQLLIGINLLKGRLLQPLSEQRQLSLQG
jgi:hypothetical protein